MGRYSGTLHKLAEAGPAKKANWNLLINYLEGYAVADSQAPNPNFDSPLPPYSAPNDDLSRELVDCQGPKQEDTPLRIAIRSAPSNVIAALCHLGPEATRMTDSKGRLPLHWACRRSSEDPETEKVLTTLALAYPEALVHRDDCGRTPLHYLLWYHAPSRSPKIVEFFCQQLPVGSFVGIKQPPHLQNEDESPLPEIPNPDPDNKIPRSAVIVHDMKHGALPLHYAVAEGASRDVIKVLLTTYPASKGLCDRRGRTALAWYLGAGDLADRVTHVSGEAMDPNAPPIWEKRCSSNICQLLLSSKVARTADDTGRYPLHWAIHLSARYYYHTKNPDSEKPCLSIKVVQLLLDNHLEALTSPDLMGMTPLHILFEAVADHQASEWMRISRNKTFRGDVDLVNGGSHLHGGYEPPSQLVEILLKSPETGVAFLPVGERPSCAAHVEDTMGRLPLHIAVAVASSANVVRLLIQSHPTSLLHTTEEQLQTPLHMALSSPYTTPLQTVDTIKVLLQAYVTSRHGTFVDGRLVLKMEDGTGRYPLHYACENQASLEVIRLLLTSYPKAVKFQNGMGELPVHSLLDRNLFSSSDTRGLTIGATLATPKGWTSEAEESFRAEQLSVLQEKMSMLIEPLSRDEESLRKSSATHGMLPLHIAVAFDAVPYGILYQMLKAYPGSVYVFTNAGDHAYSPMDLHEMRRSAVSDEENWHMIQELLFSFGPSLDAHRRQEDILERCARIVRDELEGRSSTHMEALIEIEKAPQPEPVEIATSFSNIEVPNIDGGGRPKGPGTPRTPKITTKVVKTPTTKSKKKTPEKKSIYDDDNDLGYVVSPDVSYDDDYFSDVQSHEEEYFSDDFDSRYEDDSIFDDEVKRRRSKEEEEVDENEEPSRKPRKSKSSRSLQQEDATVSLTTPQDSPSSNGVERPFLSEVATRLWMFFVLFSDPKSPGDQYAKQVDFILDGLDFDTAQKLLILPIPSYVFDYFDEDVEVRGRTVQDVANASCKTVIHLSFYFAGRYEFRSSQNDSILIHRSMDGDTVTVRAVEHMADTIEWVEAEDPGDAEAAIWATGETPSAPLTKQTFQVVKRTVCFKFMRSQQAYESEVECRRVMGVPVQDEACHASNIVPLINHFNSRDGKRKADQRYRQDLQDERFQTLKLQGSGSIEDKMNYIVLSDYPYAVVMPYSDDGDLHDHLFRHGVLGMDKIREIGTQVGKSLRLMHDKGLVHGNVSLRSVAGVPLPEESTSKRYWALSDLSCATRQTSQVSYMAPISRKGFMDFSTSAFPPEMFVKLTPGELKMYNAHWEAVESSQDVVIDKSVVAPCLDEITGDAYVLRCHFDLSEDKYGGNKLPPLPYKLLPTQEAADFWSFGRFLFILCSSGHPLFPTNLRTGHLLQYNQAATWNPVKREEMIYRHVEDGLAQDLLLRLLSSHEERATLSMEKILSHPFFTGQDSPDVRRLVEQRSTDSVVRARAFNNKVLMRFNEEWLKARSKTILCWDLDFQMRLRLAPSDFIKRELSGGHQVSSIPYSIIVLPYKLARNKAGKMTPSTKGDVELAELMGLHLIALSKACHYACRMEDVILGSDSPYKWSLSELCSAMNLPSDAFSEIQRELIVLASDRVEMFRENPLLVARRLVQERITELQCLFEDSGEAFLYLVDEYSGVPSVCENYPIEVTQKISEVVARGLPFMHLCMMYTRGVAGGVSGLVKLIFEAAFPHLPPSWVEASKGLAHGLDEDEMKQNCRILREAVSNMYSRNAVRSVDDLRFFQDYIERVDVNRTFANLKRVTNGEASIWTSDEGVAELEEIAKSFGLVDAYKAKTKTEEKLMEQERKIAELEKALEELEFRKTHNLQYPIAS